MAQILISGGTGLIGRELCKRLIAQGHSVRVLSRNPKSKNGIQSFYWNVDKMEIDEAAFDGIDHLIHLAGTPVAEKRWTKERKKDIISSRVNSMKLLTAIIKKKNIQLQSFTGASAIGIYGMTTSEKIYTETDKGEKDFLSDVCVMWEDSYAEINKRSKRNVILRIGVVLDRQGGALQKLLPLFKLGLGSAVGSGRQYMPWIHIDDMVSLICETLFNSSYAGIYNAVAPEHITSQAFSKELAQSLGKPFFVPNVPAFILKILFGEMASVLLEGSKVSSRKLADQGFQYKYPGIRQALRELNGKESI